jgi:zinc/manganese transport system substrate-binding protein
MRIPSLVTCFISLFLLPLPALADVHVFAGEPEWAALAKELGGDKVEVTSATSAQEDPHHVRAKPSLLSQMRRADLVVVSGSSLEIGWLPILLQKAGSSSVQPGKPGYMNASDYVTRLEVPTRLDRADGDIHPEGNPHSQTDPHNIALVARELAKRLATVDGANASYYQQRYADFASRWQTAMAKWDKQAAPLRGMKVVVHHKAWAYLNQWLGLQEVGELEPKPGIPPTASHLEELLVTLKTTPADAIVRTPYDAADASQWLSEKTGTKAVILPYTVGGDVQSGDLFSLFDRTIGLLLEAKRG